MVERTFSVVAMAMQEYIFLVESAIKILADKSITSVDVKEVVYLDVTRQLNARIDITQRASQNYTQFLEALVNGTPIFNYKYKKEPRNNSEYIVPLPLFHQMLNQTFSIRFRVKYMGGNLDDIVLLLENLKVIAHDVYTTGVMNATEFHHASVGYLRTCREYLQSKDMFLYDVPEKVTDRLHARESAMSALWSRFRLAKEESLRQVDSLMVGLSHMRSGLLEDITEGLSMARQFLYEGNVSRKEVAAQFLQDEVLETQSSLRHFFNEVRSRGQVIFDNWRELENTASEIWEKILTDVNLHTYYQTQNITEFLTDTSEKMSDILEQYGRHRNDLDLRHIVRNVDAEFVKSLTAMLKDMKQFQDTEEIDGHFMQENILRLNIFFRELNYEQITQQEAYDIFALLCDIGGSMGLFLGASVITIFEILDLCLFTYLGKLVRRERRR